MEKTISECFSQIKNGANIKQGIKNGGFPITRIETISNDKFNRDKMGYAGITDASQYENYILEDNDLLMSHINSPQYLGRTVLYKKVDNETIIHGMNLLRLKANKEVNPSYARYYFYGNKFRQQIIKITKKSVNQASFAVNDLKRIKMYLPEMESQNNIVRKLDIISKLIDFYNEILNKYDLLIKARFVEMFGTLDDPADEFEKATLKKLCNKITDGKHGGCTSEEGTQRYFVGAREIYDDEVHYDTAPEINVEEFEKDYKRCNIEIGDFLIVNTGATIGKSAIASDERTEHTLLQKSVALLKIKKDKLNPVFLKWCYRVNTRMYMVQSASAQPNLLLSKINGTVIYVPSIERQNQFADFVQQVDKSREAVKKSLEKTQQLYDSLMQEYFG